LLIICHFTPLSGPKVVNHRRRKRQDNTFLGIYSFLRRDFICEMSHDQIFLCLLASWLYQDYIRTRMFKLFGRYQSGSDIVMFSALQKETILSLLKIVTFKTRSPSLNSKCWPKKCTGVNILSRAEGNNLSCIYCGICCSIAWGKMLL